jgi:hypothetical protein
MLYSIKHITYNDILLLYAFFWVIPRRMNYELNELIGNADIIRYSKIYKKQENSLARSRDADGWQENT